MKSIIKIVSIPFWIVAIIMNMLYSLWRRFQYKKNNNKDEIGNLKIIDKKVYIFYDRLCIEADISEIVHIKHIKNNIYNLEFYDNKLRGIESFSIKAEIDHIEKLNSFICYGTGDIINETR